MTALSILLTETIDSETAYCRPAAPGRWQLIWIYPSAGPWHTAATILKRHHISARMTTEPDEAGTYRMLVFYTQAHDARDLLHLPLRFSPSRAA